MTKGYAQMLRDMDREVSAPRLWPISRLGFRIHPCPSWEAVKQFRCRLQRGDKLDPIVACRNCFVILDGWHRLAAYWQEGVRFASVQFADYHWMNGGDRCMVERTNWIDSLRPWLDMSCISGSYHKADWDDVEFQKEAKRLERFGAKMPLLRFWEQVRATIFLGNPSRRDILDVGTRESLLPLYLASREAHVTCLDLDISQCRTGPGVCAVKGDARDLPFDAETFHHVISTACVKHIPGDGDTLAVQEMVRVTRPDGLIAVSFDYGPKYAEYPSEATGRRIYDEESVYDRLIYPSGARLEEPADFSRSDWDDWPIREQCREVYEKGVNVQVGFVLLRKEA